MSQKTNKVIVWSTDVIRLMGGEPIGGLAVQMFFWAQVFADNGWKVLSFAENAQKTIEREGIEFRPLRNVQRWNFVLEWWHALKFIVLFRPQIIIKRGEGRNLYSLALLSRLIGVKLVFFSASDSNFEPNKKSVGSKMGLKLYHRSIRYIKYFVTQNRYQHDTLLQHFGKESFIQFNIWGHVMKNEEGNPPASDAVWVANFRKLKRAEWVTSVARQIPEKQFVLAGGPTSDKRYYEEIEEESNKLNNVSFLGPRSFTYVNELVGKSRVLLCTSTYEGFPNTFLQAWSNGLPVISTVDPSGVIAEHHLGEVVRTEEELKEALQRMLNDTDYYQSLNQSVEKFFFSHHAAQTGYENVIKYLNNEKP